MRPNLLPLLLLSCCIAIGLRAQKDSCLNRVISVTVTEPDGSPARSLDKNDFAADFEGQSIGITSAVYDTGPRRVVLVLDASPVMGANYFFWRAALAVAKELINSAPAQVSLAFLDDRKSAQAKVPFGQSREFISKELARLSAEEKPKRVVQGTSLDDALKEAVTWLTPAGATDAICVISDGPECTNCGQPSVRAFVLSPNVRVFAFAPVYAGSTPLPYPRDVLSGETQLLGVADSSGGSAFKMNLGTLPVPYLNPLDFGRLRLTSRDEANLVSIAHGLGTALAECYRLEMRLPGPIRKPKPWVLEVKRSSVHASSLLRVSYPRELAPCHTP